MKKVLIYFIIFVSLCAASGYGIDYLVYNKIDHQSPYYLSFASIGAISLESRLDCWVKINQKLSQDDLDRKSKEIFNDLGISWVDERVVRNNIDSDYMTSYTSQSDHINYTFTAETNTDKNETYLVLNVTSRDESHDLSRVEEKLKAGDLKWQYYYLYTGKLDHYVDQETRIELINVILQNLGANSSEVYEDQYMTSTTAYTPLFDNSVTVQNKKYNLQIAAKSVLQQQEAFIYIGQPLIIGDY